MKHEQSMLLSVACFNKITFRICFLQDYMGNHERQKVIELDANMPKKYMVKVRHASIHLNDKSAMYDCLKRV